MNNFFEDIKNVQVNNPNTSFDSSKSLFDDLDKMAQQTTLNPMQYTQGPDFSSAVGSFLPQKGQRSVISKLAPSKAFETPEVKPEEPGFWSNLMNAVSYPTTRAVQSTWAGIVGTVRDPLHFLVPATMFSKEGPSPELQKFQKYTQEAMDWKSSPDEALAKYEFNTENPTKLQEYTALAQGFLGPGGALKLGGNVTRIGGKLLSGTGRLVEKGVTKAATTGSPIVSKIASAPFTKTGGILERFGTGVRNVAKPIAAAELNMQNLPFKIVGDALKLAGGTKAAQAVGKAISESKLSQTAPVRKTVQAVRLFGDKYAGAQQAVKNALNTLNGKTNEVNRYVAEQIGQHAKDLSPAEREAVTFMVENGIKSADDVHAAVQAAKARNGQGVFESERAYQEGMKRADELEEKMNNIFLNIPPERMTRLEEAVNFVKQYLTNQAGLEQTTFHLLTGKPALDRPLLPNYIPHLYEVKPKKVEQALKYIPQDRLFSVKNAYDNERKLETVIDGYILGLKPELDAFKSTTRRIAKGNETIAQINVDNEWVKHLLEHGEGGVYSKLRQPGFVEAVGRTLRQVSKEVVTPKTGDKELQFENELDRIFYQAKFGKNLSKADQEFMDKLRETSGLSDEQIKALKSEITKHVKQFVEGSEESIVSIPKSNAFEKEVVPKFTASKEEIMTRINPDKAKNIEDLTAQIPDDVKKESFDELLNTVEPYSKPEVPETVLKRGEMQTHYGKIIAQDIIDHIDEWSKNMDQLDLKSFLERNLGRSSKYEYLKSMEKEIQAVEPGFKLPPRQDISAEQMEKYIEKADKISFNKLNKEQIVRFLNDKAVEVGLEKEFSLLPIEEKNRLAKLFVKQLDKEKLPPTPEMRWDRPTERVKKISQKEIEQAREDIINEKKNAYESARKLRNYILSNDEVENLQNKLPKYLQPTKEKVSISPLFIRDADQQAINRAFNPAGPGAGLGAIYAGNNLYYKGFLLNPMPHIHNVIVNGVGLGGASLDDVLSIRSDIAKGVRNEWFSRAEKAGAMSTAGKLDVVKEMIDHAETFGQQFKSSPIKKMMSASHDFLWNTDKATRAALFKKFVEYGLSESEAAAKTQKFMIDYDNLTNFERSWLRPLTAFYAWKKGNIALQLNQLFTQPARYMAIRNSNRLMANLITGQEPDQNGEWKLGTRNGMQVLYDPYLTPYELDKIASKGIVKFALGSLAPVPKAIKEIVTAPTKYDDTGTNVGRMVQSAAMYANPIGSGNPLAIPLSAVGYSPEGIANYLGSGTSQLLGGKTLKYKPFPSTQVPATAGEEVGTLLGGFRNVKKEGK